MTVTGWNSLAPHRNGGAAALRGTPNQCSHGGVANGGDNTKVINFTITVTPVGGGGPGDVAGPVVTDIKIKGSAWTAAYINLVDPIDKVAYSIPDGVNQAQALPWGNLNQLIIEFNEPVKGSGIGPIGTVSAFSATDFALLGENTVSYGIVPQAYDPVNFRLTLSVPTLPVDRYALIMNDVTVKDANNNNLDGEWDQNVDTISGNGTNGGLFEYLFNVLPGNFALNDTVTNGLDLGVLGLAYNTQLGVHVNYNKFADANGDGFVNGLDLGVYGLNLGATLPVGDPRNPLDAIAASVDSVFGQDDDDAASGILDDDSVDSIADSITVKGARSRGAFLG